MNIVVCMKEVPDTEAKLRLKDGAVDLAEVKMIPNPYDEFAVEEALRIKEKQGDGKVTVVCLGPDSAGQSIRQFLAMGADDAVHLNDEALLGGDALSTSKALKAAIEQLNPDLILCGKQAIDQDNAQVGIRLAELMGIPHVSVVTKLEVKDTSAVATREIDGGKEVVEVPLPAVITCQKGLNEPRYASLKGIMMAKRKKIEKKTAADLGLEASMIGKGGAGMEIVELLPPPQRKAGKKFEGDLAEIVPQVVKLLKEEAKVI